MRNRTLFACLHLVKLTLLLCLYITKCISSYSLRTGASKILKIAHTDQLRGVDCVSAWNFSLKDFPSVLAIAVYCQNQRDNRETLPASGSGSFPPPGACYCRVLIQGSVSDEWGEGTTLARTAFSRVHDSNSNFPFYVETLSQELIGLNENHEKATLNINMSYWMWKYKISLSNCLYTNDQCQFLDWFQ